MFRGLILIADVEAGRNSELYNGELFEVLDVDDNYVQVQCVETGATLELTIEHVKHNFRLAYTFNNIGSQGRSLGDVERIHDPERGVTIHLLVFLDEAVVI